MSQITNTGKYVYGSSFKAYSQAFYDGSGNKYFAYYSSDLGGYVGNTWDAENLHWSCDATETGVELAVANGSNVYSSVTNATTTICTVSDAVLIPVVSSADSGRGTITKASGTLYGDRYVKSGDTVTFDVTASSGYVLKGVTVNGSAATVTSGQISITASSSVSQYTIVASFSYSVYTIKITKPDNATLVVKYDGVEKSTGDTVSAGKAFNITATANAGYTVTHIVVNSVLHTGTSYGFTLATSDTDGVVDIAVKVAQKSAYQNSVDITGTGSITIMDGETQVYIDDDDHWSAVEGKTYTIKAEAGAHYQLSSLKIGDTEIASGGTFTQGAESVTVTAVFTETGKNKVTVESGIEVVSHPTLDGDLYVDGEWTFRVAKTGVIHIDDLSYSGNTTDINVGAGATSSPFKITFNANVSFAEYESDPSVPDQMAGKHSTVLGGVRIWQGGSATKTAVWKSRRYVFSRPVALSCACVYADGYTNSPVLEVHQFQSPNTDAKVVSRIGAMTQTAFRLPAMRSEKYLEIGVETTSEVTHIGISTSMGELWQAK